MKKKNALKGAKKSQRTIIFGKNADDKDDQTIDVKKKMHFVPGIVQPRMNVIKDSLRLVK